MKTTIAVVGVGLIGGSLAYSLRENGNLRFIGYDVREDNIDKALTKGILHAGTNDLQTAVREADVIFLAAPVEQIYQLIDQLAELELKPGVIISDVGSTKLGVVQYAERLVHKEAVFIGGHPMAGSHKSGVEASTDRLFENAYYILTPAPDAPSEKVEHLKFILSHTRAHIVVMEPGQHDEVVGSVSHFPHILAALLVNQVSRYDEQNGWHHRLAAGGFRDITRIASSNPRMWRDILLNNREFLIKIAADWRNALDEVMTLVENRDGNRIEEFFRHARDFRDNLPEKRKGALPALYDLYIDIPDHPGEISRITTLLGAKDISITNIQILETREDILGVLRITFRSENDIEKGEELLRFFDYNVYTRE